jgi:hypothetical protein
VSLIKEGKRQDGKMFTKQHKAQKWAYTKRGPTKRSPWHMHINKRMIKKSPKGEWRLKNKGSWKTLKEQTKRKCWNN